MNFPLRLTPRAAPSQRMLLVAPLLAVALTLLAGGDIMSGIRHSR